MATDLPKPARSLSKARLEMIEVCGRICQLFGLPRSVGQIYGLLYVSREPLSLDTIAELIGISKASASTGTRQLAAWGGLRQVWIPGARRDFFAVEPDLGNLLRSSYAEFLKPRLASSGKRLTKLSETLDQDLINGCIDREEYGLLVERLRNWTELHNRLQSLVPIAERLFEPVGNGRAE